MYGFTLAISCCIKTSNIPSKIFKYIDVPLLKAVTITMLLQLTTIRLRYHTTLTMLLQCKSTKNISDPAHEVV